MEPQTSPSADFPTAARTGPAAAAEAEDPSVGASTPVGPAMGPAVGAPAPADSAEGTASGEEPGGTSPYAGGRHLGTTADHLRKWERAARIIRDRADAGAPLYNFSGLRRGLPMPEGIDEWTLDDEFAEAVHGPRLHAHGLEHLGGRDGEHGIAAMNRLTAAVFAAMQVTVRPGSTVIGLSATYSHPCVHRAVRDAGGRMVDTVGIEEFERALASEPDVSVVAVTRLAVSYRALPEEDIRRAVRTAREHGALVVLDDAGGARVGPAVLGQPRSLEFGVDLAATGLDKYGVAGPRVGLLGGRPDLVAAARGRAVELGSECRPVLYPAVIECLARYRPEEVRALVASNAEAGRALRARLGASTGIVTDTPFIFSLSGPGLLAELTRRSSAAHPIDLAPVEASALVAMVLLADHGILTVHFAGMPPGTQDIMIKFLSAATLAQTGGPAAFAEQVDIALTRAAALVPDPAAVHRTLFG